MDLNAYAARQSGQNQALQNVTAIFGGAAYAQTWDHEKKPPPRAVLPAIAASPVQGRRPDAGRSSGPQFVITPSGYRETGVIDIAGIPSAKLYQDAITRDATIGLLRQTQYLEYFDDAAFERIEALGNRMLAYLVAASRGPYTNRILAQMGHPYGYDHGEDETKTPVTAVRNIPRSWRGLGIGGVKGVRGSVPTKSIINRQSGTLEESWHFDVEQLTGGVLFKWSNGAKSKDGFPYPWALARGTRLMQPHGPWNDMPARYISEFNSLWAQLVREAKMRSEAEYMLSWSFPEIPIPAIREGGPIFS